MPRSRAATSAKAAEVVAALRTIKPGKAAELVEAHVAETSTYYAYLPKHWLKIRTNNLMERLLKDARPRTKVVGAFPDGQSALMLVAARLHHVSTTSWGLRKDMNMDLLRELPARAPNVALHASDGATDFRESAKDC